MQLVINISEEDYINIKNAINSLIANGVERASMSKICLAILDGTPLPKKHGRLIDADAFITTLENVSKRQKYKEVLIDDRLTVDDVFKAIIVSLQHEGLAEVDAPTIIEADKAESEG